ncbi:ThuA domain-containing protein [Paenibacillus athensensis]|uniref:ThuA-like domain-containing protein n=1 Tax=Paenibacillus athensensis TaxID=1967502 RepID=A0A4Y8Q1G0_9BACL|nr:ThuA domain-containing protein [Paenibacillus athensensis]MCD1261114.1 ThuA domain-containing protein [Paenibacillus athensensis]
MSRIAAVIGDFYHPEGPIREALAAAHAEALASGALSIDYYRAEEMAQALASGPDAVILFKEDRLNPEDAQVDTWMTDELQAAIVRYVEAGGGWLAWHSGLASYPVDGAYTGLLRGYFLHHPEQHSVVTYGVGGAEFAGDSGAGPLGDLGAELSGDPVAEPSADPGAEPLIDSGATFAFSDEHYFVACDEANTEVFLRSSSRDGEAIAGWRHAAGAGRVCCLTPAHKPEGLNDPHFQQVLRECVRWSAGEAL